MDLLLAKKKAAAKIVDDDDISSILEKTKTVLSAFISDSDAEKFEKFSIKQIISIRDSLIASAAVRLPRRSKELMRMTIEEVNQAETVSVQGENMHIIKVSTKLILRF